MQAVAVLFIFSFFASAEESCRGPLSFEDQKISSFSNAIGEAVYFNEDLNGCSWEKQMKYYGSLKRVAERLERLIQEVKAYDRSGLSSRERKQVRKVRKTLECIQKNNLDAVSFRCHELFQGRCGPRTRAYVDGVEKSFLGITIKEEFPTKEIHVCAEKLEGIESDYRDALIMHELTHFCGSEHKNEKYFLHKNDYQNPRAALDNNWHENGDQFAYWYIFPFCVPGVDCSDHFFKED